MARSGITRLVKTLTFSGAGLVNLVLDRQFEANPSGYITYNGEIVNQSFTNLFISNKSASLGSYCVEADGGDAITVNLTPTDTVKTLGASGSAEGIIVESDINFSRLRVYLNGAGTVEIVLNLI